MATAKIARASPHARLLGAVLGRETVVHVASVLAPHDVPVAPLKGVLLAHTVYADPLQRPSTDVDLLVPTHRFRDALAALTAAGYTHVAAASTRSDSERCLRHPTLPALLDLHRALFAPHRYALPTSVLFARASLDTALFGVAVRLLDPLDVFAHLVGHFANDHVDARDAVHLDDLVAVARVHALDPRATAHRLASSGLARASRYTLGVLAGARDPTFARAVLDALPPDPLGHALASMARTIVAHAPPRSALGTLPAHLLNRSLATSARAALHSLTRRLLPPPA